MKRCLGVAVAMVAAAACSNSTAPFCGDGSCGGGETCTSCTMDCGACPVSCGNGACDTGETCSNCAGDCGTCTPTCSASCAGCCDGTACLGGASSSSCGSGGAACVDCGPDTICMAGGCYLDPASHWNIVLESLTVPPTRYDGAAWDTIGGSPDPIVSAIVGSATATPVSTPAASDLYSVTYSPTPPLVSNVRADAIVTFVGFSIDDDDSPAAPDHIGYCTFDTSAGTGLTAAAFTGASQTLTCPLDAPTMNSGFTLHWHLEPF